MLIFYVTYIKYVPLLWLNSYKIKIVYRVKWIYYPIIYYTILYYTILYYTILYYTILYYTILS